MKVIYTKEFEDDLKASAGQRNANENKEEPSKDNG